MRYIWSAVCTVDISVFISILYLSWLKHRVQAPSIPRIDLESKLTFITSSFVPDFHEVP